MAYHLATLGYTTRCLESRHLAPRALIRDVCQGRAHIRTADAENLAASLGLEPDELTRSLTDEEFNAWAFNSASTRHRLPVWRKAQSCWIAQQWPLRQAAHVLAMSPGRLHDAIHDRAPRRLLFHKAVLLSTALKLDVGARTFLSDVPHHWREGCSPLRREV